MPTFQRFKRGRRGLEDWSRDIGDKPNRECAPGKDAVHGAGRWVLIRPFAAEEVSQCEVDEDQADDAGPDEVARAEDIADQTSRGEFGGEGGHAGDEDSEEEVAFHIVPLNRMERIIHGGGKRGVKSDK